MEGRIGLKPVIEGLKRNGLLEPCTSPFNTPILPVKKIDSPTGLFKTLEPSIK
jgi:hypothetical protein